MAENKTDVKVIVFNNGYLGLVREYQHNTYNKKYSMVDLGSYPNLSKIAEAYSMPYLRLSDNKDMEKAIDDLLATKGSAIMECIIDPMDTVK